MPAPVEIKGLDNIIKAFGEVKGNFINRSRAALRRSINKVARGARTDLAKGTGLVRQHRKIKSKEIRKRIVIIGARERKLFASLIVSPVGVRLMQYSARKVRRGVTINVSGTRKLVKGAFIATMKSGHKGVFRRRYKQTRYPIDELFSTSVRDAIDNVELIKELERGVNNRFRRVFLHELEREVFWFNKYGSTGR